MTAPKYVILPGYVRSRTDNDLHYVNSSMLIALYKVDPKECVILGLDCTQEERLDVFDLAKKEKLIFLGPRYDGNYQLPESPV
jgi:hypothetical protein